MFINKHLLQIKEKTQCLHILSSYTPLFHLNLETFNYERGSKLDVGTSWRSYKIN